MSDPRAQGFLQHIAAEPDDDTPRLIFADWLDEHGDSDRAEFIRVQIERARLPKWDAHQVRLALRERALLCQHERQWLAQLPRIKGVVWDRFRRGFVATAVFVHFALLRQRAAQCWTAAPLEEVSVPWPRRSEITRAPIPGLRELVIRDGPGDDPLTDAPLLSTVRILTFEPGTLDTFKFQRLTASPHLGCLEALCLAGSYIGDEGVQALVVAASLDSLEELDLSQRDSSSYGEPPEGRQGSFIGPIGLETLACWPGLARLRSLNLSGHSVGQRGLRALLRSPYAVGLKELILRGNGLSGEALQALQAARSELRLEVLDLGENPLGDLGAAYLAKASCLSELKVLQLRSCQMSPSGAEALAAAPFLAGLRRLNANSNNFGSWGLRALLNGCPRELHTLRLVNNGIDNRGVAALLESPASDTLLELNLAYNRIYEDVAAALRNAPLGKRLAHLDLFGQALSSDDETPSEPDPLLEQYP